MTLLSKNGCHPLFREGLDLKSATWEEPPENPTYKFQIRGHDWGATIDTEGVEIKTTSTAEKLLRHQQNRERGGIKVSNIRGCCSKDLHSRCGGSGKEYQSNGEGRSKGSQTY